MSPLQSAAFASSSIGFAYYGQNVGIFNRVPLLSIIAAEVRDMRDSVNDYNRKIERLREECERLTDDQLEYLTNIFDSWATGEEIIQDMVYAMAPQDVNPDGLSSEEYELTQDYSNAYYKLSQICDAAEKELERRQKEKKNTEEFEKAIHFLEIADQGMNSDPAMFKKRISDKYDDEIAELAIEEYFN